MTPIPENVLGLKNLEDLIQWTTTYFHFKQALDVVPLTPEITNRFFDACEDYTSRLIIDIRKQDTLESRLPKKMRETIAAEKPNLTMIRELLKQKQDKTAH